MAEQYVLLKCVKEGSKLRVKMMSSAPFVKGANCQFPRAVREEGTYFVVKASKVKFKGTFYTAMSADTIVCQTKDEAEVRRYIEGLGGIEGTKVHVAVIFGDEDADTDCAVCMSVAKDTVFVPCGHYACCGTCAQKCATCPICRSGVASRVRRADVE